MRSAKAHAAERKMTLRALIERGIYLAIREERTKEPFVLEDASVDGQGLNPDLKGKDWSEIRALAYEGRGS